jgi:YHS domain-containing protein
MNLTWRVARRTFLALVANVVTITTCAIVGASAETRPSGRRLALRGYDPVAYFTLGRPVKGNATFWYAFDDAIYHFASVEHRAKFAADPERYAPQYAGFCAAAMSRGEKHEPDPEAWAIVNGKLYVVALKERIEQFKRKPDAFIGKADANWPNVKKAPAQD